MLFLYVLRLMVYKNLFNFPRHLNGITVSVSNAQLENNVPSSTDIVSRVAKSLHLRLHASPNELISRFIVTEIFRGGVFSVQWGAQRSPLALSALLLKVSVYVIVHASDVSLQILLHSLFYSIRECIGFYFLIYLVLRLEYLLYLINYYYFFLFILHCSMLYCTVCIYMDLMLLLSEIKK